MPFPLAGAPLTDKLRHGDLCGEAPESELEGVAECLLDPLAGDP